MLGSDPRRLPNAKVSRGAACGARCAVECSQTDEDDALQLFELRRSSGNLIMKRERIHD